MMYMYIKGKICHILCTVFYLISFKRSNGDALGKTRMIVFHHIDSKKRFQKIIHTLKKKYHIISFQDYLNGKKSFNKINVIVSLDDGYKSWHQIARNVLIQFSVKPLLFVNSKFIGLTKDGAKKYCINNLKTWPKKPLSWKELEELTEDGAIIGGHSWGHVSLTDERVPKDQKKKEIILDKKIIEDKLKKECKYFAYPFGLYNASSVQMCKEVGYQAAFTCNSGYLEDSICSLEMNRTNVGMRSPLTVCAYVEGWGEFVTKLSGRIRRMARPPSVSR